MHSSNLRTYGRHKKRVVVADNWLSDQEKKLNHVFSSSSSMDSSKNSLFHVSSSSSGIADSFQSQQSMTTHGNKKDAKTRAKCGTKEKENEDPSKKGNAVRKCRKDVSSSSECSMASSGKSVRTRALRDKNKVEYNDSTNFKKQLKGTTAKRKRPVRTCANKAKELSANFSDFDNYSLVISDSPLDNNCKKMNNSLETSTPVAKRTRHKPSFNHVSKVVDISTIEDIHSPIPDISTADTPESAHSCSLFDSPSVLTSHCSDVSENGSGNSVRKPVIEIQRLSESLLASARLGSVQVSDIRARQISRENIDLSASLFSTPKMQRNMSLLMQNLQKNNLHDNTSVREISADSALMESANADSETDDDDDDDDDVSGAESDEVSGEEEDNEESVEESNIEADMSAISEDLETSDTVQSEEEYSREISEEEEEDEDTEVESDAEWSPSNNSDSEPEYNDLSEGEKMENDEENKARNKGRQKKACGQKDKLSESLLKGYIVERKRRHHGRRNCANYVEDISHLSGTSKTKKSSVNVEDEIEGVTGLLERSHISSGETDESNCTLYKLNTDSVSNDETGSPYQTADEGQESVLEDDVSTPPRQRYSFRGKHLKELQNSFTELLTPTRRKSSLVPLSAQARVFLLCDQTEPVSFNTALPGRMLTKCRKIGEGVYGEVFRTYNKSNEPVAIKVIPIEGDFEVNDEKQKKFDEIVPEIVIAKELSNLRDSKTSRTSSFCKVNSVSCVQGKYPAELLKQWDLFHKAKRSENDRPDVFPSHQLFIVFEFADCGSDVENYKFETLQQAKSVLVQVAYALAVAEESLKFEHRDLHWGNVLVRPTKMPEVSYHLMGHTVQVPTCGVEASVIDFTMSRLTKDKCTVYTNLAQDETLFQGKGDYQFDIYRRMKEHNKNDWEKFCPYSNVLWLNYLSDKLIYHKAYPTQSSREERDQTRQFRQFVATSLKYSSAMEMSVDALFLNT